jgi:pimeloyl-ACP methyl ester carboxylesterase
MRVVLGWLWLAILAYIVFRLSWMVGRAPRGRRLPLLLKNVAIIAVAYFSTLAVFLFLERALIFRGLPASEGWADPGPLAPQEVTLPLADGVQIHAWWCPTPQAQGVLLYSHGNAGNLSGRAGILAALQQRGFSILIYDYPGYGKSTGAPDEANCYAAGRAAYRWLTEVQKIAPADLILWGKSLGAAIAIDLALELEHRALVLFSPFTSIPDMAQHMFPFFPARWLVRTQFDNAAKMSRYRGRVLIGWYEDDPLVPAEQSRRLFELSSQARERKYVTFPGRLHSAPPERFYDETRAFAGQR